jgi:hypothetical protein
MKDYGSGVFSRTQTMIVLLAYAVCIPLQALRNSDNKDNIWVMPNRASVLDAE